MRPTLRLVLLFLAGVPVALLPVLLRETWWPLWAGFTGLCVVVALVDSLLMPSARRLGIEYEIPDLIYIGDTGHLGLHVQQQGGRGPLEVELLLEADERFHPVDLLAFEVPVTGEARVDVPLTPRRRGLLEVRRVWLRWHGPWRLIRRMTVVSLDHEVAVSPNLRAVKATALRFFSKPNFLAGLKTERYIGEGSEFDSLREFLPGHDLRSIDWKATARHRKLLCREYRAERNHQIVLAFDTGRLMQESVDGIPRLDQAITAGLVLAYVGLKAGDAVGLSGFDDRVRLYVPPAKGMHAFARLQRHTAELDTSTGETNYTLGLTDLTLRLNRRSLILLMTDFHDSVTAELMIENLGRLARRHVVICLVIRDRHLYDRIERDPVDTQALQEAVVAHELVQEREHVFRRLRRLGVHLVEGHTEEVTADLVNRYLDIKRRELVS